MAAPEPPADLVAAIGDVLRSAPPSDRIGVAVSGGGDSMALLIVAIDWAARTGASILAATVDHGLRDGSAVEARDVEAFCGARGIAHATLVANGLIEGLGLQARARDHRYALLSQWAKSADIGTILLGHTSDDVAETLLMRLRRGVGLDGLAAMRPIREVDGVSFARPFLHIERATLRADLIGRGIPWNEDPSNCDDRFERAGIRKAMAALDLAPGRLARSARHLDAARGALDASIRELAARAFREDRGDLLLRTDVLPDGTALDRERLRRLLLLALRWIGGSAPRQGEQDRMLEALPELEAPLTLAGCLISPEPNLAGIRIAREAGACGMPVPFGLGDGRDAIVSWDRRWHVAGRSMPGATIAALVADVRQTPWRETGLPRASLMATPALRQRGKLVAAPLAGLPGPMTVTLHPTFAATLRPA